MLVTTEAHRDFIRSEAGFLLREDVLCWGEWLKDGFFGKQGPRLNTPDSDYLVLLLDKLFITFPKFRTLFDYRLSEAPELKYHLSDRLRRASELYINRPIIGPRFRIQHGQNTYVLASEIGSDFWVNHNVTIGLNGGLPTIGNRVTIRVGAVVVGPITIGDDAIISANAVVAEDMPAGYAAYAPRTVFKPRKK